jgi:hypothetical protein
MDVCRGTLKASVAPFWPLRICGLYVSRQEADRRGEMKSSFEINILE